MRAPSGGRDDGRGVFSSLQLVGRRAAAPFARSLPLSFCRYYNRSRFLARPTDHGGTDAVVRLSAPSPPPLPAHLEGVDRSSVLS